jgi:alkylated DNA repair dioxygenase AlkB
MFIYDYGYWSYTPQLFNGFYYCKLIKPLSKVCKTYFGKTRGNEFESKRKSCVYLKDITKSYLLDAKSQGFKYEWLPQFPKEQAPKELLDIWARVEEFYNIKFDYVLCHVYSSGINCLGWHSDHESDNDIVSISLGETRKFKFRNKKTKEVTDIFLNDGDSVHMYGPSLDGKRQSCQKVLEHCVPVMKKVENPRINLTFRTLD